MIFKDAPTGPLFLFNLKNLCENMCMNVMYIYLGHILIIHSWMVTSGYSWLKIYMEQVTQDVVTAGRREGHEIKGINNALEFCPRMRMKHLFFGTEVL